MSSEQPKYNYFSKKIIIYSINSKKKIHENASNCTVIKNKNCEGNMPLNSSSKTPIIDSLFCYIKRHCYSSFC